MAPALWALRLPDRPGLSPLYAQVYETALRDSFVWIEKAQKMPGWQPRYSRRESLIRNHDGYVANLERFASSSGVTQRVPWKQGTPGLAKRFFQTKGGL